MQFHLKKNTNSRKTRCRHQSIKVAQASLFAKGGLPVKKKPPKASLTRAPGKSAGDRRAMLGLVVIVYGYGHVYGP